MRIHQGVDNRLPGAAAHSFSGGRRHGAKELPSNSGWKPPHTDQLGATKRTPTMEDTSSSTGSDAFESCQPWLGYW